MPLTGVCAWSGTIQRKARPSIGISLLLWCAASFLALLSAIQLPLSYSTHDVAVLDAFEQDLGMSLFVDDESHIIDVDMQVTKDQDPAFLSLGHSAHSMVSTSSLDAAILGKVGRVIVNNPATLDYQICNAIDIIQKAKAGVWKAGDVLRPGFTVSYVDESVFLFAKLTKAGTVSKMYSYSYITGVTHSSRLTNVILYVKQFHEEFVKWYTNNPAAAKANYPTVREILFTNPITMRIVPGTNQRVVRISRKQPTTNSKSIADFDFPTKLTVDQLGVVEKLFSDVLSKHYSASNQDFIRASDEVLRKVQVEHSADGISSGGDHYDIRVTNIYADVQKTASGYTYITDGLDEIHRCMHQGVYLIRAFCDPITGVINEGPFTKSTFFAIDYMRIPTGQTLLDREIAPGKLGLQTHVTSRPDDTLLPIAKQKVLFTKGSTDKSIEFHRLRTRAAFFWKPVDMATYVADKNNIKDMVVIYKLEQAFRLPQVHDRMNGYCEELTSVALTLNPEALVKEITDSFNTHTSTGAKSQPASTATEKEVGEKFEEFLKIPLGTNSPRANMRKRVKDGVKDVVKSVCKHMGWANDKAKEDRLNDILIRKTTREALNYLPALLDKSSASDVKVRVGRTTGSFRGDNLSAGSVATYSTISDVDAMTDSESDDDMDDAITGSATTPSLSRSNSDSLSNRQATSGSAAVPRSASPSRPNPNNPPSSPKPRMGTASASTSNRDSDSDSDHKPAKKQKTNAPSSDNDLVQLPAPSAPPQARLQAAAIADDGNSGKKRPLGKL